METEKEQQLKKEDEKKLIIENQMRKLKYATRDKDADEEELLNYEQEQKKRRDPTYLLTDREKKAAAEKERLQICKNHMRINGCKSYRGQECEDCILESDFCTDSDVRC